MYWFRETIGTTKLIVTINDHYVISKRQYPPPSPTLTLPSEKRLEFRKSKDITKRRRVQRRFYINIQPPDHPLRTPRPLFEKNAKSLSSVTIQFMTGLCFPETNHLFPIQKPSNSRNKRRRSRRPLKTTRCSLVNNAISLFLFFFSSIYLFPDNGLPINCKKKNQWQDVIYRPALTVSFIIISSVYAEKNMSCISLCCNVRPSV